MTCPQTSTRVRVYSTGHGTKTDDADTLAIARAALHSRHLRIVKPDDETVAIKLRRIAARSSSAYAPRRCVDCTGCFTRLIPGGGPALITAEKAFDLVNDLKLDDPAGQMRVEIALEHIEDIMRIDLKIDAVASTDPRRNQSIGNHLDHIYGIGPINAALIIGEVGDVSRFPSHDHFASYTGTAPVAASSGDHHRHRLNRAGNRQLNHALYIAAITQIRNDTPGRDYYRSKLAAGKSTKEALRCLMRRISDAAWRQLQLDRAPDQTQDQLLAPLAVQGRQPSAIQIARHAAHERPTTTLQTRSGLTSMPGSGCGLTEASAPRRKLITPADRKVQQTSSSAHPEPTS